MTDTPYSVLFVCMGNICRSPAGENILRHLAEKAGVSNTLRIDSAGTIGYHSGKAPDRRMSATLRKRGIPSTGSAREVDAGDLSEFDLILAADKENLSDLLALPGAGTHRDKIRLVCDFATEHDHEEVPDPYYDGEAGFELVADLLEDACAGLLARLAR